FTFPVELDAVWIDETILVRDAGHNGSFGAVMLFDPATGTAREVTFCAFPGFFPISMVVAPHGSFLLRCAMGNPPGIDVYGAGGVFQGFRNLPILPVAFDAQGRLLGTLPAADGHPEIYCVDLTTGESILLASVAGQVRDLNVVPPVPAFADAFIRQAASNTNEGANPRLRIQAAGNNRALVGFDLSGLNRALIARATL